MKGPSLQGQKTNLVWAAAALCSVGLSLSCTSDLADELGMHADDNSMSSDDEAPDSGSSTPSDDDQEDVQSDDDSTSPGDDDSDDDESDDDDDPGDDSAPDDDEPDSGSVTPGDDDEPEIDAGRDPGPPEVEPDASLPDDPPDAGESEPEPEPEEAPDASLPVEPPEEAGVQLCGNGMLDPGEQCDHGVNNDGSYGGCNEDCTLAPYCGDGNTDEDFGEECDDGDTINRDGCSSDCRLWFDASFSRRTKLDLHNPTTTLATGFPVLVELNTGSIDWEDLGDTGVCFVAADESTVLAYEAELWEPGSGSLVWVRVPELPPGLSHVWLYYGNFDNAEGCAPTENVWRDEFVGVWHMNGPQDSSIYAHPTENQGTSDAPGQVGRGRRSDAAGKLVGPSDPVLQIAGDLTISAWVNYTSSLVNGDYRNCIVSYGGTAVSEYNTHFQYGLYVNANTTLRSYWAYGEPSVNVNVVTTEATGIPLNELHHLAMVRSAADSEVRFYYDGVLLDTRPFPALPQGGDDAYLVLGGNVAGDAFSMVGVMDEVRLSNIAHSSDWILLEYRSMTGNMVLPEMDPATEEP